MRYLDFFLKKVEKYSIFVKVLNYKVPKENESICIKKIL